MDNEKICPLLTTNTVVKQNSIKIGTQPVICLQQDCAWWDTERQKCAVAVTPPRR